MLEVSNLTAEERRLHEIYKKNRQKVLSREAYVFDQGIEQGDLKRAVEVARKMIEDNFSIEMIERYVGLSVEKIKQLLPK